MSVGEAAQRLTIGVGERNRDPLNGGPTRIEPSILDARNVGLRYSAALGELRLRPAEFDPAFAYGIARVGEFGESGPAGHEP